MGGNSHRIESRNGLNTVARSLVTVALIASLAVPLRAYLSAGPMVQALASSSQGIYTPINPIRICDTRAIQTGVVSNQCNTNGNGTLSAGSTLQVNVAGQGSIPANATAVVVNVTATNTTSPGYLTIYPTGATKPNSSSINFTANESIPNLIEVALGSNGDLSIYNFMGSTDVIVDVQGYVAPPASQTTAGQFVPLAPIRICDTRAIQTGVVSNQCNTNGNGTLSTGSTLQVKVAGLAGIPSNASAVVANVTATNTTSPGFLTVFPGPSLPTASNLNFGIGQSVANRVIVPINSNGEISIYNFLGSLDVIVDINGYYTGNSSTTTGSFFTGTTPFRICDTRAIQVGVASNQCNTNGNGTLNSNSSINVQVVGLDSIPANAVAVVINVTTTNSVSGGFFTLYPQPSIPTNPPVVSDLNWAPGETRANLAIVKIGVNNSITLYSLSKADLIIDVMGYYSPQVSTIPIPVVTSITPNSGPTTGGTQVTITGSGFSGATTVDFGATAASFTFDSDSQITATSPSGSTGTIDITVTSLSGTSATSTQDSFTNLQPLQILKKYPAYPNSVGAITCPSTSECFAGGQNNMGTGIILESTDSGAMWTTQATTSGNAVGTITCPSTTECFAGAATSPSLIATYTFVFTTNSGANWNTVAFPSGYKSTTDTISCPSSTECFVGGSIGSTTAILGSTNSGTTWTQETIPSGLDFVNNVTCASTTECFALGANATGAGIILGTTNSGATWTTETIPSGTNYLFNITCASPTECFADGQNSSNEGIILGTTNSGATWTTKTIPSGMKYVYNITCASPTECFADGRSNSGDGIILGTTDSGLTWTTETIPSGVAEIYNVTCASVNECFLDGQDNSNAPIILGTNNSGATWTAETIPSGLNYFYSITCASVAECFAYGANSSGSNRILGTTDSGSTWTTETIPSAIGPIYYITCPSTTECFADADSNSSSGIILSTTDSGATWTSVTLPTTDSIYSITCPSPTECFGGGDNSFSSGTIIGSTNAGSTWNTETIPSGISFIGSIICPSTTECFATGTNSSSAGIILSTTDSGATWTSVALPIGDLVSSITCPSTTECFASISYTDSSGGLTYTLVGTTDSGSTWTIETPASATPYSLACPTATECLAVGYGYLGSVGSEVLSF